MAVSKLAPLLAAASFMTLAGCRPEPDLAGLTPVSYQQLRYRATVRQLLDFTCGGASLATILTHYWNRPTTEAEILEIFRARYPDEKVWKAKIVDGFSFDDIAFAALVLGFEAAGAKVPLDQLPSMNGPVIVHLDKGKFQHFTVLRRAQGDTYYLSDPTVGLIGMPSYDFAKQYTGNAMAIWPKGVALPSNAPLSQVRDGLSVSSGIWQGQRELSTTSPRMF